MKSKLGVPYEGFAEYCRVVAREGIVLLKNEQNCLPIKEEEKVSIFGRCQIEYYRSGTGSGGAVNVLYSTNLLESFLEYNAGMVNEKLVKVYKEYIQENPFDNGGGGWACEPWNQKELFLTKEIVEEAKAISDKAIIVIGRTAGEDKDNLDTEGSYRMTEEELNMLKQVSEVFDQVCVVLNIANIIDMSPLEEYSIQSIVCSWTGGMEGGRATVDVLTGQSTPCGKLPDTVAYQLDDYPSNKNHGGDKKNIYQEDIYVGYRYFETFAKEKVQFPFGYGLSYTSFELSNVQVKQVGVIDKEATSGLHFSVTVKNSGDTFTGKEVVQVYMQAPQGKLGKASRVLVGFAKTNNLAPEEEEVVEFLIPYNRMVSFDDSGITGACCAYVLEAGEYVFYVGTDIRATNVCTINGKESLTIEDLMVLEPLTEALAPIESFKRIKPIVSDKGELTVSYETVPTRSIDLSKRIHENLPKELTSNVSEKIQLKDVREKKATIEEFVGQLDAQDLAILTRGEGMSHPQVTPGTASAFAGVSEKLRSYGIPLICCADGPSGIRMEGGLKSTQVPIGTLLASTWDEKVVKHLYNFTGKEMVRNYVDVLLGPGMNIHRSPLNGRNFEYFSEDPLLTGVIAKAIVIGIHESGADATLKHFACNSQETHRHYVDAVVSQRAVREIYLKGFEIAVKEAPTKSIMTAYNPINGHWTASNYDLNTTILRGEWNYTGFVMTDWWAKVNHISEGGNPSKSDLASMVKAQNDVYMVVGNFEAQDNVDEDNLMEAFDNQTLMLSELQRSAINICNYAMNSTAMNREFELFAAIEFCASKTLDNVEQQLVGDTTIKLENKRTYQFHCQKPGIYEFVLGYTLDLPDLAQTTCVLKLNGEIIGILQVNTTNGNFKSRVLCRKELEIGGYEMEFENWTDSFRTEQLIIRPIT